MLHAFISTCMRVVTIHKHTLTHMYTTRNVTRMCDVPDLARTALLLSLLHTIAALVLFLTRGMRQIDESADERRWNLRSRSLGVIDMLFKCSIAFDMGMKIGHRPLDLTWILTTNLSLWDYLERSHKERLFRCSFPQPSLLFQPLMINEVNE